MYPPSQNGFSRAEGAANRDPPMLQPPTRLYSESVPRVDPILQGLAYGEIATNDPNFAIQANKLVNESLGRTPGGLSVIDPSSVLGDSGRLYHGYKDGKYYFPNDAAEQDRLDLQHHLMTLLLDGWYGLAPLQQVPEYVLDVATGTGIWALEFAEKFPQSQVIGTDLSAIQPEQPHVPNCTFQRDDAEDTWVFPAPHPTGTACSYPCEHRIMFDYVHLRLVSTCFDDPRVVMKNALDNMKPGGWIEFQDASLQFSDDSGNWEGSALQKWSRGCIDGAAAAGRDILVPQKYKQWLEEVGFVDVQERPFVWPLNPWPQDKKHKEVGLWELRNLLDGLRGMGWKLLTQAGYSPEEIETLVKESHEYLRDCRNHPYCTLYVVYGRKPFPDDAPMASGLSSA